VITPRASDRGAVVELAEFLATELPAGAVISGLVPGAIGLARAVADRLGVPAFAAPVMALAPPWNAEPAYGAVAFDGSAHLDDDLLLDLDVDRRDLERAVATAREAIAIHRVDSLELARRHTAVIDDGQAPAIAVAATVAALRNAGAARVVVAVSSGSCVHLRRLASAADRAMCARFVPHASAAPGAPPPRLDSPLQARPQRGR
jgi:putative phosphoribosyl transferase